MGFPTRAEYEKLVFSLAEDSNVVRSTLRMFSTSALAAIVQGSLHLANGLELRITEALDFKNGRIQRYSYTVLDGDTRVRWYDPQPHPDVPELADTLPHHLHEEPESKHNRRPAASISYIAPNLAHLVEQCLQLRPVQSSPER
jgi:hypothetical protein